MVSPFGDAINAGAKSALGHASGEALAFAAIVGIIGVVAGLIRGSISGVQLTRVLGRITW